MLSVWRLLTPVFLTQCRSHFRLVTSASIENWAGLAELSVNERRGNPKMAEVFFLLLCLATVNRLKEVYALTKEDSGGGGAVWIRFLH